jgi:hypothetical protein
VKCGEGKYNKKPQQKLQPEILIDLPVTVNDIQQKSGVTTPNVLRSGAQSPQLLEILNDPVDPVEHGRTSAQFKELLNSPAKMPPHQTSVSFQIDG